MQDGSEDRHVAELDQLLGEARESAARMRRAQMFATLGLVAVFVVAVGAMYVKGRAMYTAEAFQASLAPQLEELRPDLEDTARNVVDTAGPHYARLGQERLEDVIPALGAAVRVELDGMSASLASRAERKVTDAIVKVEQKQVDRLRRLYPDLDQRELERLSNKWAGDIQRDTELVLADFHERAMTDFTILGTTIESFGPSRFDDMPRDELVRYYAHLWLSLVDDEILHGDVETKERRDG
jgi:hypothetical protein